jgi:hypothetical protein
MKRVKKKVFMLVGWTGKPLSQETDYMPTIITFQAGGPPLIFVDLILLPYM